ncbi:MAG: hypothetical protein HON90_05955 [Halobacteriovoraceae bacterium]|nr:hypothetical protein [Halobacteriovoraceae bacterium]
MKIFCFLIFVSISSGVFALDWNTYSEIKFGVAKVIDTNNKKELFSQTSNAESYRFVSQIGTASEANFSTSEMLKSMLNNEIVLSIEKTYIDSSLGFLNDIFTQELARFSFNSSDISHGTKLNDANFDIVLNVKKIKYCSAAVIDRRFRGAKEVGLSLSVEKQGDRYWVNIPGAGEYIAVSMNEYYRANPKENQTKEIYALKSDSVHVVSIRFDNRICVGSWCGMIRCY